MQGFGSRRRGVEVCGCGVVVRCCCDFDFVGVLFGVCNYHLLNNNNDNKLIQNIQ